MGVDGWSLGVRLGGALALLLFLGEAAARLGFSGLPSLSPMEGAPATGPGEPAWTASLGEGEAFRLLAIGDSVTLGVGVETRESYPWRMAEAIAADSREVEVANAGKNAAGFAENLAVLEAQADAGWDLVVFQIFGDDAERLPFRDVGGALVAYPSAVESPWLRWLLEHSHGVNLLWWKMASAASSEGGSDTAGAYADTPLEVFEALAMRLVSLGERVEAQGGAFLVFLLPPAGSPGCEGHRPASRAEAECGWLLRELGRSHEALVAQEISVVDLRGVYDEGGPYAQPGEVAAARERQRVAPHPNAEGQARIAERLLAALQLGED